MKNEEEIEIAEEEDEIEIGEEEDEEKIIMNFLDNKIKKIKSIYDAVKDIHTVYKIKDLECYFQDTLMKNTNFFDKNVFFRIFAKKLIDMGNDYNEKGKYSKASRLYSYALETMESIPKDDRTGRDIKEKKRVEKLYRDTRHINYFIFWQNCEQEKQLFQQPKSINLNNNRRKTL